MTKSRTIERLVRLGIHGEPFGYVDGPNKYQFVKGNPVNYTDSSGLAAEGGGSTTLENVYAPPRGNDAIIGDGELVPPGEFEEWTPIRAASVVRQVRDAIEAADEQRADQVQIVLFDNPTTKETDQKPPERRTGVRNEQENPKGLENDALPRLSELRIPKGKGQIPLFDMNAKLLQIALQRILATARGHAILQQLLANGVQIHIHDRPGRPSQTVRRDDGSWDIWINMTTRYGYFGDDGLIYEFTLERILAHELGHTIGALDDGPGGLNNVNANENGVMREFPNYVPRAGLPGYQISGDRWIPVKLN